MFQNISEFTVEPVLPMTCHVSYPVSFYVIRHDREVSHHLYSRLQEMSMMLPFAVFENILGTHLAQNFANLAFSSQPHATKLCEI